MTQGIIVNGGEGMILRQRHSVYVQGKASQLIKFKVAHGDKEGLVVEVDQTSVKLEIPTGQVFSVPLLKVHVLPLKGDVVTFSHKIDARKKLPVDPEIVKIRTDINWKDVLTSYSSELKHINVCSQIHEFKTHSRGHWTTANMRLLLESVAHRFKMDPLHGETWYKIPPKVIYQSKIMKPILNKFGTLFSALKSLFPDIVGLDGTELLRPMWNNIRNRRFFFESFAKGNCFDPLNPENWYSQSKNKLMSAKGIDSILSYHKGNLSNALMELFPEIGLQKRMLAQLDVVRQFFENYARDTFEQHGGSLRKAWKYLFPNVEWGNFHLFQIFFWETAKNRRNFFEKIAQQHGFDSLQPTNWLVHYKKFHTTKDLQNVLIHHHGNLFQALIDLFPDVKWENFHKMFWQVNVNRRNFFERFAKKHNFDPLVSSNWHPYYRTICTTKNAQSVLQFHNGKVSTALKELFPEVNWQDFHHFRKLYWHDAINRRNFFENFAKEHGFDPLRKTNWYLQSKAILITKYARSVLSHHDNQVSKALKDLFPEVEWGTTRYFKT